MAVESPVLVIPFMPRITLNWSTFYPLVPILYSRGVIVVAAKPILLEPKTAVDFKWWIIA